MKALFLFVGLVSFSWAQETITVTFEDPAIVSDVATVLGLSYTQTDTGYTFNVPSKRLNDVTVFFQILRDVTIVNINEAVVSSEYPSYFGHTVILFVDLDAGLDKLQHVSFSNVYQSNLKSIKRFRKPGNWFILTLPKGILARDYAQALQASPWVNSVDYKDTSTGPKITPENNQ